MDSQSLSTVIRRLRDVAAKKLEELAGQTADGVKRGIVPLQELLNSQATLERYKFELAEMDAQKKPVGESPEARAAVQASFKAVIQERETELARADALLKQKIASAEEVRRLKIDLNRLKAEAAVAAGDHKAAVEHTEAAKKEFETTLNHTKMLVERGIALRPGVRRQLADIVAIREQELREAETLFDAKAILSKELKKTEHALLEARLRLAGAH